MPAENTTLYHYCSTLAFHSIIESRTIRLGSMSLANDSLEGKLASSALRSLAKREGLSVSVQEEICNAFLAYEDAIDGLAFCLSEHGDLLSQWRGYGSDGTGLSIGFSKSALQRLSEAYANDLSERDPTEDDFLFKINQVRYAEEEHLDQVRPFYEQARHIVSERDKPLDMRQPAPVWPAELRNNIYWKPDTLGMALFFLFHRMFLLKSPAFAEEREWRLLSFSVRGVSEKTRFFPALSKLIPFRLIELSRTDRPIESVVLGPKHQTPPHLVKRFLAQNGFSDVTVTKSTAPYR